MKKAVLILVTLLTLLPVFALSDAVNVWARVKNKTYEQPVFGVVGIDSIGTIYATSGAKDITSITTTAIDISENDISIDFDLVQEEDTLYNGLVTVQVIPTAFKNLNKDVKTTQPQLEAFNLLNNSKGVNVSYTDTLNLFSLKYSGIEVVKSCNLGSFTVTWPCSENAPEGEYEATVSLVYAIQ